MYGQMARVDPAGAVYKQRFDPNVYLMLLEISANESNWKISGTGSNWTVLDSCASSKIQSEDLLNFTG
jgi:hypothetical protein